MCVFVLIQTIFLIFIVSFWLSLNNRTRLFFLCFSHENLNRYRCLLFVFLYKYFGWYFAPKLNVFVFLRRKKGVWGVKTRRNKFNEWIRSLFSFCVCSYFPFIVLHFYCRIDYMLFKVLFFASLSVNRKKVFFCWIFFFVFCNQKIKKIFFQKYEIYLGCRKFYCAFFLCLVL